MPPQLRGSIIRAGSGKLIAGQHQEAKIPRRTKTFLRENRLYCYVLTHCLFTVPDGRALIQSQ